VGIDKGQCQLAEIELSSGLIIHCDIRHKLKNEVNKWIDFENLNVGDFVALPIVSEPLSSSKYMTWEFIYGFIIGDGYLYLRAPQNENCVARKGLNIVVGEKKKPILLKIKAFLEQRGYKVNYREILSRDEIRKTKYAIGIERKKFAEHLEKVGLIFGCTAHTKEVPASVWTSSDIQIRNFLEGLWLSDGARRKTASKRLHMCNKKLLQQVQILSTVVGFDSILRQSETGWRLDFTWKGKNKKPIRKMPRATINKALLRKDIKFPKWDCEAILEKRHIREGKDISQYVAERIIKRFNSSFETYRYDTIKSITTLESIDNTYTMSVDNELHQFIADGVITKNSAFHCLLWAFIELDRIMQEEKWDTRIIGQIHDAIILDVHPDELEHVKKVIHRVTCEDLPKAWEWIIVPLEIEMDLSPVDKSWAEKKKIEN